MNKNIFKTLGLILLSLCIYWGGVFVVEDTTSYFSHKAISGANIFSTGELNLAAVFETNTPGFVPEQKKNNLKPEDEVTATAKIKNQGNVPLRYSIKYNKRGGSDEVCENLQLKAYFRNKENKKYEGSLVDFTISKVGILDPSHNNNWFFKISLPSDASEGLQEKECQFGFVINAYQTETMQGFSDEESIEDTIKTNSWDTSPKTRKIKNSTNSSTTNQDLSKNKEKDKSVEEEDKKEKEPAKLNDDETQDDDEAQNEDESSEDEDESEDEDDGNSNEENSEKEDDTDETNNEN